MPDQAPVKSARRIIEIFEFFAERQSAATLTEIARSLDCAPSSASALLNTMRQLGYLDFDRRRRMYLPTIKAALLGIWVNDMFLSDGTILRLMHELREKTGETVALATQSGLHVQYIHVLSSLDRELSPGVATGRLRPLLRSAVGQIILSLKEDREVLALVHRINAEESDPANRVRADDVMSQVETCRRQGYGYSEGAATPGSGLVAVLIAPPPNHPPAVLGIGAEIPKLRQNKMTYVSALRRAVQMHSRNIEARSIQSRPTKF